MGNPDCQRIYSGVCTDTGTPSIIDNQTRSRNTPRVTPTDADGGTGRGGRIRVDFGICSSC